MSRVIREGFSKRDGARLSFKNKEDGEHDQKKTHDMVPTQGLFEVNDGKDRKNDESDDFLDRLKLGGRKCAVADAVGRHLEAVFKKSDQPAGHNNQKKGRLLIFQVAVPGKSHKDV